MSKELIESIIDDNLVSANDIFAERMNDILERKLYENKRMMQVEVVTPVKGKPGQLKGVNTKADWAKYRKSRPHFGAFDVPDKEGKPVKVKTPPKEKTASGGLTKHGIEMRRKKGYMKADTALKAKEFMQKILHYHKTGEITETIQQDILNLGKQIERAAAVKKRMGTTTKGTETPVSDTGTVKKAEPKTDGVSPNIRRLDKGVRSKTMNVVDRYMSDRAKAKELSARGHKTAMSRLDKAYGSKRYPAMGVHVLKAVKKGFETIGQTGGGI